MTVAVQNYITAILVFLVIEMMVTWGYYRKKTFEILQTPPSIFIFSLTASKICTEHQNTNGSNIGSSVLLITVAILNAARNSFSFFLLLIVCMGYGVVKLSLGRTMVYVRWLAITHFIFGLIYAITSLVVSPETAGKLYSSASLLSFFFFFP